eukprot:5773011-Lingulodinium_polyedra.AAC.1
MQPQVSLLKVLMQQGSLQWDLQQWSRILSGQGSRFRLAEAARGQVAFKFFKYVQVLMHPGPISAWGLLSPENRTRGAAAT